VAAIRELGKPGGFAVDATEDATSFTPTNLARYRAIVFLNSSGDVFDNDQKEAFRNFIQGGGGLAAVHQGITTLDQWPWYVALVGGVKFAGHPQVQQAICRCAPGGHPAIRDLGESWNWTDEWYNFSPNPRPRVNVLVTVDESSYKGGTMGEDHPVSWYRNAEGGRVWCTALGHTEASYGHVLMRKHLLGGIRYAAGIEPVGGPDGKPDSSALDPQARAFLERMKSSGAKSFEALALPEARKTFLGMAELAGPPVAVDKVEDRRLPGGLRVRIYTPAGLGPKPALIYFHGGGWALGSPETVDGPCRRLAKESGCVVFSVDYALAPEHRFPKPSDDCYAATSYLASHAGSFGVDPHRIAVGGDSAGGNLAAAVTLMARDRGSPALAFQLLVYPVTNHAFDTPSYHAFGTGHGLTTKAMQWVWENYLTRSEDGQNPLASPLLADLHGLPPALIITAEFDPLRDEGEAYAARLRAAGVITQHKRYKGQIHGFFLMGGIMDRGLAALDDTAALLRTALRSTAAHAGANQGPHDRGPSQIDRAFYARYAREHPGDPAHGRELFFDAKAADCARCHRCQGQGGQIGPDLSDVGGKFDRDLLIESVLDPSRQIVEGYRPTVVTTTDGQVIVGIVKGESDRDVTLVDTAGHRHLVQKSAMEKRVADHTSLMPDGLASRLSSRDFADLIAYLRGLRMAGQGAPGSSGTAIKLRSPGFSIKQVATGITGATALAVAPDGRIFVCEQTGRLRVFKNGVLLTDPFLTVDVDCHWERGLIGVAVDPDFVNNRYVYVCYVTPLPFIHHRIGRFTAIGDRAESSSEFVVFDGDDQAKLGGVQPAGHQGGAIHFGSDGKLYIALGEQTAGMPAQQLTTLQGKILRVNTNGTIPEDNPFYKTATGKYRAIWALGLRNPFTFAVQPETGRIFINDVGQSTWEEINEGFAGANYGWPTTEGPTSDPRFRAPIHHYPAASIAGGAFSPTAGSAPLPAQFRGKYFFMDFIRGSINFLDPDHPGNVQAFASGLTRPVDLAFNQDGSLYILQRDAWVVDSNFRAGTGALLRIFPQEVDESRKVPTIHIAERTVHGDMECIEIQTATATYVYGKRGAGFASIFDRNGRDWISYQPGGEARGEFRGLPKCGQPIKYFHCGYGYGQYRTDNPFESRVTVHEVGHARIQSETRDGKSACLWDFYPDHATMTLLRIDLPTFWFLYEGTPAGKLDADHDFVIRPDGTRLSLDQPWNQVVPWVCFGSANSSVGLLCVNHQKPEPGESDSYVSWPFLKTRDGSFQDMTVFGFGRKGHETLVKHVADLRQVPARYSIALISQADHATAVACDRHIRSIGP
jgi:acetyl esterase